MKKFKVLAILFNIYTIYAFGQTPINDNSWVINSSKSDEFNSTTLDSKWSIFDVDHERWGVENYRPDNVTLNGS